MNIEISELSLAAALLTLGFIPTIKDLGHNKYTFCFSRSSEVEQAINAYWNNSLKLNPKFYWNSVRELKARTQIGGTQIS